MRILMTMLALTRLLQLKRQWRAIAAELQKLPESSRMLLAALVYGEAQRISKHPLPRFYASSKMPGYSPWGDAAETAFQRAQSTNLQLRLNGLATWLAVVYHETRDVGHPGLHSLHADVEQQFVPLRNLHQQVLAIRMAA